MLRRWSLILGSLAAGAVGGLAPSANAAVVTDRASVPLLPGVADLADLTVGAVVLSNEEGDRAPVARILDTAPGVRNETVYLITVRGNVITTTPGQVVVSAGRFEPVERLRGGDLINSLLGPLFVVTAYSGISEKPMRAITLTSTDPSVTLRSEGHTFFANNILLGDDAIENLMGGSIGSASARTTPTATAQAARAGTPGTTGTTRIVPFHARSIARLASRGACIERRLDTLTPGDPASVERVTAELRAECPAAPHVRLFDRARVAARKRITFDVTCPAHYRLLGASVTASSGRLAGTSLKRVSDRSVLLGARGASRAAQADVRARCESVE